ncbi:ROK family transcriptional regulator [uncultured Thioclava sp.]|uniref:ROK family transcriptional regulator n=1 Tax=uncultured Thioclava sp. TaxID=473858 RepID=UPI0025FB45E3|nr:ROK family transcriptional regulator [uncultured Thioclava sp.]
MISQRSTENTAIGCGPLILPLANPTRPLRQQIFERVRASGEIARVQLAKDLGVSPASVTTITSELIEGGLLEESTAPRDTESARGRPAVSLRVRRGTHHVVGIKLSDREHTGVIVDFAGNVVASAAIEQAPGALDPQAVVEAAADLVATLCSRSGLAVTDFRALGLGVPGFVDGTSGIVHWSPILDTRHFPLRSAVQDRLGIPTHIDNDANLVTLAELWFGAGRALSDFAVVTIEHGVGMGYVINHQLYRGARGMGMELGHTKVQLDGALCRCGQRGCLEAYLADYALVREARTALNISTLETRSVGVMLESLFDHAKAGNGAARAIFRRAGRYLALGLSNVVNLFDPQLLILSGERMRYDYLYARDTLSEMSEMMLDTGRTPPPVEIHAWGDLLWAHGAAALALHEVTEQMLGQAREMAAQ